jgi:hypothetical protein
MSSNLKPSLLLGLPTNGMHSYLFTQFLMGSSWPTNYSMFSHFVPGYEVGDARNILVQDAIDVGAKYLMFIDEDVIGPAHGARQLLYRMETHPDWTVCGGVYPIKAYPPEPLIYTEWMAGPYYDWRQGEVIKVVTTGCGFHVFRVDDLKNMKAPQEYHTRNPWTGQDMAVRQWFKTDKEYVHVNGRTDVSVHTEDSWFYKMAEDEGLQVWIDTDVQCGHFDSKSQTMYSCPIDEDRVGRKPDPWNHEPRVCNLGAGRLMSMYEVNVDLKDAPGITYRCDIRKLPGDWAGQFDIVKSNHVLEHFKRSETYPLLEEWVRILKVGGKIQIKVPDLLDGLQRLVKDPNDVVASGMIYGDQGDPYWNQEPYGEMFQERYMPWSYENNSHKNGFTIQSLCETFKALGLKDIKGQRNGGEIYIEGVKKEEQPEPTTYVDKWNTEEKDAEVQT